MFGFGDKSSKLPGDEHILQMLAKEHFHVIVALDNKKLVGGLNAYERQMFKRETKEMFLYEIEVSEPYRKKGIAKALIDYLKQICFEKGIVEMFVGTEKDNLPARKLYTSTGARADEDTVWFYYLF